MGFLPLVACNVRNVFDPQHLTAAQHIFAALSQGMRLEVAVHMPMATIMVCQCLATLGSLRC